VVRPTHALEEGGETPGRADLADQLDRADVDPKLQGGRGHEGTQISRTQSSLDPVPPLLREASVVRGDPIFPETLPQLVGHAFGHPSRIHEHDRGSVLLHVLGYEIQDLRHLLRGSDRTELVVGELKGQIEVALMADVHDRAARRAIRIGSVRTGADQQPGNGVDRSLRG
jgi:hypothetical protein